MPRRLILILVVFVSTLVPASASAYLPAGFIGISPQSPTGAKDFELMNEAGIDSVRLPMYWAGIQPKVPLGLESNWKGFDTEVELAAEAGISVLPVVYGTPDWAAREWKVLPVRSSWQRWGWTRFLSEAERRFGPGGEFWEEHTQIPYLPIRMWEIWNEENIVTFAADPNPVTYAKLLRISGRTLHRKDPGSKVILGGLFGRPLQIPPNVASGDFLQGVYRAKDVKPFFDGVGLHPYVADAAAMGAQLTNLRRIMRLHKDNAASIYLTELGWGSQSGPTRWQRGLWGQAEELSKAFEMLSEHRQAWGVAGVWWFTWTDEDVGCPFCRSAGLLTADREAKPSWYRFNAWTGGDPDTVPRARFGE
jgi:hypothetical protein